MYYTFQMTVYQQYTPPLCFCIYVKYVLIKMD